MRKKAWGDRGCKNEMILSKYIPGFAFSFFQFVRIMQFIYLDEYNLRIIWTISTININIKKKLYNFQTENQNNFRKKKSQ